MDEAFPYEFIKPIGGGGFGDVWLVRQKKTQDVVALKIMRVPDDFQNNLEARERFMREIEIASLLDHPHILPALDHGYVRYNEQVLPYLVSPYLPDGSLGELISRKKMPPWEHWTVPQTVDAIVQAAEALQYIHTLNPKIIHQDVKPGNFLFRWERNPAFPDRLVHLYLTDFGISRWQKTDADVTANLFGSIEYMAPERFEGRISWTADLYALAVMAYLFLVGKYPIRRSSGNLRPLAPSLVRADRVPYYEIDDVLLKALEADPQERYSSVIAFARALQRAAHGEAENEEERTVRQDISSAETARVFVPVADERIPVIGPVADRQEKSPAVPKPGVGSLPFRLPFEQQLQRQLPPLQVFSKQLVYEVLPAVPNVVRWSSDGQSLVCTFYGRQEALLVGKNGRVDTLKEAGSARLACWGAGDRLLALSTQSASRDVLRFWNRDAPSERLLSFHPNGEIGDIDWSKRGQLAVWAGQHILLYALPQNLSSLVQAPVAQPLTGPDLIYGGAGTLRWSPDGTFLAAGTLNGMLMCWNMSLETPTLHWQISASGWQIYSLAWSPDGTYLAAAFSNKRVVVWDVLKKEQQREWKQLPFVPRIVSISPSNRLAIASRAADLLFGALDDPAPTGRYPGHWFVAWSPVEAAFASLDAHQETALVIWGE